MSNRIWRHTTAQCYRIALTIYQYSLGANAIFGKYLMMQRATTYTFVFTNTAEGENIYQCACRWHWLPSTLSANVRGKVIFAFENPMKSFGKQQSIFTFSMDITRKKNIYKKKKYEMSFDHRIKSIKRWQQPWLDCSCLRKADNLILCCLVAALHCRAFIGRWHSLIRFVHVLIDGIAAPIDIIPITLLLLLAKCTMMMYEKYIEITTAATVIAVMLLLIMP